MALDILRVVQIMWAVGDVLLTGGAFALLGIYGDDQGRNCRRGGLVLWTLCGIAPLALYIFGETSLGIRPTILIQQDWHTEELAHADQHAQRQGVRSKVRVLKLTQAIR